MVHQSSEDQRGAIPYDDRFYEDQPEELRRSAEIVLGSLYSRTSPDSVLDVGCGRGQWLAAAAALGSRRLVGVEGEWVRPADLVDPSIELLTMDLERPERIDERFDLCLSLEVAEHLPGDAEDRLVDLLCAASDVVLFSAAVPGQGGTHHVNEAWQSHWASLFEARGYGCVDFVRREVWHDDGVKWWYRQNVLLYVRSDSAASAALPVEGPVLHDVVHPEGAVARERRLQRQMDARRNDPPISDCLACLKNWIAGRARRAVRRGTSGS